jgi:hypothetical protein
LASYLVQLCPTSHARSDRAEIRYIEQSLFTAVLNLGGDHVPLRTELRVARIKFRPPASSSAARAAAPVIDAAARAEQAHQRPLSRASVDP